MDNLGSLEEVLALGDARIPFVTSFESAERSEVRELPPALARLLPLLERYDVNHDLEREISPEQRVALWELLVRQVGELHRAGKAKHSFATAATTTDIVHLITDVIGHGLTVKFRERSHIGIIVDTLVEFVFGKQRMRRLARRALTGQSGPSTCRSYALLFQILFWVTKRSLALDQPYVIQCSGSITEAAYSHIWNWVLSLDRRSIVVKDLHSAARAVAGGEQFPWNERMCVTLLPNVSGFASDLIAYSCVPGPLEGRSEIPDFLEELFASVEDNAYLATLLHRIGLHGNLHPVVENKIAQLCPAQEQREDWRERLRRARTPFGRWASPDVQLRLLESAFRRLAA